MTVDEFAQRMFMEVKDKDIPDRCRELRKEYCEKYGGCSEVILEAFRHYAREIGYTD